MSAAKWRRWFEGRYYRSNPDLYDEQVHALLDVLEAQEYQIAALSQQLYDTQLDNSGLEMAVGYDRLGELELQVAAYREDRLALIQRINELQEEVNEARS